MSRDVIDLPRTSDSGTGGSPPPSGAADSGGGLPRVDRALRLGLAAAWLTAAVLGLPSLATSPGLTCGALAGLGAAALLDLAPRATALAGLVVSLVVMPGGAALAGWLAVVAAAGVRAVLWLGRGHDSLARVRALRRERARQAAAMELRRAHARALPEPEGEAERTRAGDAFERAGRAGGELRTLGVEVRGCRSPLRFAAPLLARSLPDRLRSALVQRLETGRA